MIISMKLCRKKVEIMHMGVIWEFRENHLLRQIAKDLARIQSRNEVRAKKVARGRSAKQRRRVARRKTLGRRARTRASEKYTGEKNKSRE